MLITVLISLTKSKQLSQNGESLESDSNKDIERTSPQYQHRESLLQIEDSQDEIANDSLTMEKIRQDFIDNSNLISGEEPAGIQLETEISCAHKSTEVLGSNEFDDDTSSAFHRSLSTRKE